jgi:Tfp pilus assembly PilM family ATPase
MKMKMTKTALAVLMLAAMAATADAFQAKPTTPAKPATEQAKPADAAKPADTTVSAPAPDPQAQQQLQAQLQQLVDAYNASQETVQAQATALAAKSKTIQQLQQQLAPACIAAVEKANPTKTLDPQTLVLKDKPAAGKKDGGQ